MLGLLASVIEKTVPLIPELTIKYLDHGFVVYYRRALYTMGLLPNLIGELEEELAVINIADVEDGLNIVVTSGIAAHNISLTVPDSGRVTDKGYEYEWRLDEAAVDLAQCLKRLAAS